MTPVQPGAEPASGAGGALHGLKVVELAGLGPVPFCAMMLADHGADVIRVERPGAAFDPWDPIQRNRRSLVLDLKSPEGLAIAQELIDSADVFLEGFRPGVIERLGLGPETCLGRNPRLVYGRLSGWGRKGPLQQAPGRDINYLALSGALLAIGPADAPPSPPLNLVGDYGGGAMFLTAGILMALVARERSGRGQVVDTSLLAGATSLTAWVRGQLSSGQWIESRESNLLDGGAPYYRAYACKDRRWIAVGALDEAACHAFLNGLGVAPDDGLREAVRNRRHWPQASAAIARLVAGRERDEWIEVFAGSQACVSPVLGFSEAAGHAQHAANRTLRTISEVSQPGPAPEFSATPAPAISPPGPPGQHSSAILRELGFSKERIDSLIARGIIGVDDPAAA